jgi:biopolymer transport protein ExbB/TolQ
LTSVPAAPKWKTGTLWGILAIFLVVGTVGAATVVYGLFGLAQGDVGDLAAVAVGAIVAVLAFLFMAGILYRVDRYRGATERRIDLFE